LQIENRSPFIDTMGSSLNLQSKIYNLKCLARPYSFGASLSGMAAVATAFFGAGRFAASARFRS